MKYLLTLIFVCSAMISAVGIAANATDKAGKAGGVTWEVPIAAGVWYPGDGEIPEKPMRYYRARCWPGCHVGSSQYGMFPNTSLSNDRPIFPTSTIDRVADGSLKKD
ncbi:MAG: hypothetical protein LJE94_04545 [Deltaproteobacteria bacterium]|nr:hypothetical protein [Deltaproteobacteria bacterium]